MLLNNFHILQILVSATEYVTLAVTSKLCLVNVLNFVSRTWYGSLLSLPKF